METRNPEEVAGLAHELVGKVLQGKPRSKPESGNPTFRDCRGAPGNVAHGGARLPRCNRKGSDGHSPPNGVARPDSIPTPGAGSFRPGDWR